MDNKQKKLCNLMKLLKCRECDNCTNQEKLFNISKAAKIDKANSEALALAEGVQDLDSCVYFAEMTRILSLDLSFQLKTIRDNNFWKDKE